MRGAQALAAQHRCRCGHCGKLFTLCLSLPDTVTEEGQTKLTSWFHPGCRPKALFHLDYSIVFIVPTSRQRKPQLPIRTGQEDPSSKRTAHNSPIRIHSSCLPALHPVEHRLSNKEINCKSTSLDPHIPTLYRFDHPSILTYGLLFTFTSPKFHISSESSAEPGVL